MHLLFYSPQSLPSIGGLQYVVHYWAEELSRRGHRVTLLTHTPDPRGEAQAGSYSVLRNAWWWQQWKAMRRADKVVMFNVSLKGLPLVLLSGKPLYVTHHTALWYQNGPRPLRQRIKQWVANVLAKGNCACSAYIADLYKKCRVIHSPFRSDLFTRGHLPRIPRSILFVGRLVSDKGVDVLLSAFHRLQYEMGGISLTIVGDGPEKARLAEDSTQWGETDAHKLQTANSPLPTVTFTGSLPQPEVIKMMHTHEIMVVPSRMEPMGMVVAEGLACGCRMVVSNQGGMPEVGGAFCRYFESENAISLATALQEELTNPLQVNQQELNVHLHQFTIGYSANRLQEWLMDA